MANGGTTVCRFSWGGNHNRLAVNALMRNDRERFGGSTLDPV